MIKEGDFVRLVAHPDKEDINHVARVNEVHVNGTYTISNLNMPFQGTIANTIVNENQIEEIKPFPEEV